MGNHSHHALICVAHLVEELGDAASRALVVRDSDPIFVFADRHRERCALLHAARAPLDRSVLDPVLEFALTRTEPEARALVEAARRVPKGDRQVSRVAQRALASAGKRLEAALNLGVPGYVESCARELGEVLAGLDAATLPDPRYLGVGAPLSELFLCCVPELHGDVGLGEHADDLEDGPRPFVEGRDLFTIPWIGEEDDPPQELFERTVARFGLYGVRQANDLVDEDVRELCGDYWHPPVWARGDGVRAALAGVERELKAASDTDLIRVLTEFRGLLLEAVRSDHAVVEWLTKF